MSSDYSTRLKERGVYLLLDPTQCAGRSILSVCEQALDAGVSIVQLRSKLENERSLEEDAGAIRDLCRRYAALFILNDFPNLAKKLQAHGVHLGQKDMSTAAARKLLAPHQFVGRSNSSVEQAVAAEEAGADYLAIGSIFPTTTKRNANVVGLQPISQIKARCSRPLVAIGGIGPANAGEVIEAGADFVCSGSAITASASPFASASALCKLFNNV